MTVGHLDVTVDDHVATVTLDRAPVNAVDRATLAEIGTVFARLGDDRDVRAAIFTAAGSKAFMAGADLRSMGDDDPDHWPAEWVTDPGVVAREALWSVYDCAVPVVAAVNGAAIGAGVAFAAVCDMIVAAEGARFGTTEIDVGLLGASAHLSLLVPRHKAREMYLTGELVDASELYRLGAVREVVPADQLMARARDLAGVLASKSPIAMRLAKEAMNRVEFLPLKDAYRVEQDYTRRLATYEDAEEARRAFVEKRDPEWRWR
ncbi:MAG TPA: enoyl-CoA hydratase-related protein [Microthrixaceae bacterium]|nr:enoyl-CoA hydratase-related protein [Microthrixaceae bacterium]